MEIGCTIRITQDGKSVGMDERLKLGEAKKYVTTHDSSKVTCLRCKKST